MYDFYHTSGSADLCPNQGEILLQGVETNSIWPSNEVYVLSMQKNVSDQRKQSKDIQGL